MQKRYLFLGAIEGILTGIGLIFSLSSASAISLQQSISTSFLGGFAAAAMSAYGAYYAEKAEALRNKSEFNKSQALDEASHLGVVMFFSMAVVVIPAVGSANRMYALIKSSLIAVGILFYLGAQMVDENKIAEGLKFVSIVLVIFLITETWSI